MKTLAQRNRRAAVLTFAGIGLFHLVGFGVVALLLEAGRHSHDREIPQRPLLVLQADLQSPPAQAQTSPAVGMAPVNDPGSEWTARHKDASGPWTIDAHGEIHWR